MIYFSKMYYLFSSTFYFLIYFIWVVISEIFSEGIIAFVEKKKGKEVTIDDVNQICKEIAAYKRPSHVVILEYNTMPLNRVQKTDYVALNSYAGKEIEKLRASGGWDKN